MRLSSLFVLIAVLFLTACTTISPPPHLTDPRQSARSPATLSHWQLRAALGIHTPETGANASVRWQQIGPRYEIQILDPLGMSRAQLTGTTGHVVLIREGTTYTARDPEALLHNQLNWTLPISNLVYWIRGIPAPGELTQATRDQQGHLTTLIQQGWHIAYTDYVEVNHTPLPRKIRLTRSDLQVRLVIQQWTL